MTQPIYEREIALSTLTTFHIGGPASELVTVFSDADFVEAVCSADADGTPLLVVGGGSNLLCADAGFPGRVVRDGREEVLSCEDAQDGSVLVTAPAGMRWDALVKYAVEHGLSGLEALSGIPGTVGAVPIQNVGAYGHEVAEVIASMLVYDRRKNEVLRADYCAACHPAYRNSDLKRSTFDRDVAEGEPFKPTGRWIVLNVTVRLQRNEQSSPVQYKQLANALGIEVGQTAPIGQVRDTVMELRRSKGMVSDDMDHDTWSAGSFFTNPIVSEDTAARLPEDAPRYPAEGGIKLSAAWLIQNSGLPKGSAATGDAADDANARATLSTKHVLALTNRGDATAQDIVDLAKRVQQQVQSAFGVKLVPEPVFVNLDPIA